MAHIGHVNKPTNAKAVVNSQEIQGGSQVKIEKGIPMPAARSKWGWLREMNVGESAFIAGLSITKLSPLTTGARPSKFSGRTVTEGGKKGVRLWRTA